MSLLDEVIETYLRIENLTLTVQEKIRENGLQNLEKTYTGKIWIF